MIIRLFHWLNKYSLLISSLVLAFIFSYHLINGVYNVIMISDNLDSEITNRLLPKRAGNLLSFSNDEIVPQLINGIKRNSLNASSFNIETLLFYWFPPIWAYLINWMIINTIAFAGFYLLLSRYTFRQYPEGKNFLAASIAFTFILLPAFTIYGMAVLGTPMLIYSVLNILHRKQMPGSVLFIVIYPFYSSLILGGFIIVGIIFLTGIWYLIKKQKQIAYPLFGISILIGGLFVISEINLFNQFFFDKNFISHRTAWDPTFDQITRLPEQLGVKQAFRRAYDLYRVGEINAKIYPQVIGLLFIVVLLFQFKSAVKDRNLMGLALIIVLIALIYGFYFSNLKPWIYLKRNVLLLKMIRIDRIFFFWPVLWYIFLALLVRKLIDSKKTVLITLAYIFIIVNMLYVAKNTRELKINAGIFLGNKTHSMISWKKYFAEDLFVKVKHDIGMPLDSYRVVSVGFAPAVSQYNGFYTLDIYSNNYPLDYKFKFREIIAPELEKSVIHRTAFDKWGGECFIFTSEIEYRPKFIPRETELHNLELNTTALYNLGGRFIFSALEIKNFKANNLEFFNKYTDPGTPLNLWVYKVLQPDSFR